MGQWRQTSWFKEGTAQPLSHAQEVKALVENGWLRGDKAVSAPRFLPRALSPLRSPAASPAVVL